MVETTKLFMCIKSPSNIVSTKHMLYTHTQHIFKSSHSNTRVPLELVSCDVPYVCRTGFVRGNVWSTRWNGVKLGPVVESAVRGGASWCCKRLAGSMRCEERSKIRFAYHRLWVIKPVHHLLTARNINFAIEIPVATYGVETREQRCAQENKKKKRIHWLQWLARLL